jgi:DNA (cytosine-5)-methyltransferase 1
MNGVYRILDLFCGAGGAAMGLHRAFPEAEIVGVDIKPQPHYPFKFVLDDAMTYPLEGFDFIWASPPCQAYSRLKNAWNARQHEKLIPATRERLMGADAFWVIENVVGAELSNPSARVFRMDWERTQAETCRLSLP